MFEFSCAGHDEQTAAFTSLKPLVRHALHSDSSLDSHCTMFSKPK